MREHTLKAADYVFKNGRMSFTPHTKKLGDAIANTIGSKRYPSFRAALDDFTKDLTKDKVKEDDKK